MKLKKFNQLFEREGFDDIDWYDYEDDYEDDEDEEQYDEDEDQDDEDD